MKKTIAALVILGASALAWALPSVQQVEAEVQQGRTVQAESMMAEVVAAKPDSAKAHYVYAELLARNGRFDKAAVEAREARRLDPAAKYADPAKVSQFEQLLAREQQGASTSTRARTAPSGSTAPAATVPAAPSRSAGIPGWIWLVGVAAIGWFLWRGFSRSRGAAAAGGAMAPYAGAGANLPLGAPGAAGAPVGAGTPMSPGMPYGQAPAAGGGWLRTGAAVAGGVAGGVLLDRMLNSGAHAGNDGVDAGAGAGAFSGGGNGLDNLGPGNFNDPAADELGRRDIDFGNGGDWDSGGSTDMGGGSDGGWD